MATIQVKDASGTTQTVPVLPTNDGTTLPVSGTVSVTGTVPVSGTVAVTGSFYQSTQPVSLASLPLPSGAATAAKQDALITALGTPLQAGGSVTISNTPAVTVSGVATAAKQDTLLTAINYTTPSDDLFAITPGTTALATIPKALLVTAAGTLAIGGTSNTSVALGNVTVGQLIPVRARYVYSTGTTATVVGLV